MIAQIKVIDGNYALLETLNLDITKYKMVLAGYKTQTNIRVKHLPDKTLKQFLSDNNIFLDYVVVSTSNIRWSGFCHVIPSVVKLITDVKDDRPLPDTSRPDSDNISEYFILST